MRKYIKLIAFAAAWVLCWSYLVAWEGKFDPGANGPVGRKEFIDSLLNKATTGIVGDTMFISTGTSTDTILINEWISDSLQKDTVTLTGLLLNVQNLEAEDTTTLGAFAGTRAARLNLDATADGFLFRLEETGTGNTEYFDVKIDASGDLSFVNDAGVVALKLVDATAAGEMSSGMTMQSLTVRTNVAAATYETNVTATELGYLANVTSDVQNQIDSKAPGAGTASIVTVGTVASGTWQGDVVDQLYGGTGTGSQAASMALVTNASSHIVSSTDVSATELGYLANVSSDVQNQLDRQVIYKRNLMVSRLELGLPLLSL